MTGVSVSLGLLRPEMKAQGWTFREFQNRVFPWRIQIELLYIKLKESGYTKNFWTFKDQCSSTCSEDEGTRNFCRSQAAGCRSRAESHWADLKGRRSGRGVRDPNSSTATSCHFLDCLSHCPQKAFYSLSSQNQNIPFYQVISQIQFLP